MKLDNKIIIAGIGPGSLDYISPAAMRAIKSAKILIGGRRALNQFSIEGQITFPITADIPAVIEFIKENIQNNNVVVMASGDPGYYSILDTIRREFPTEILEVIPSISAMQLAFAKLALSWHHANLLSFHGRRPSDEELKFKENKIIGMLTDGNYNSHTIPKILLSLGWSKNSKIAICSRLSYDDEKIIETTLEGALKLEVVKHGILIVQDQNFAK